MSISNATPLGFDQSFQLLLAEEHTTFQCHALQLLPSLLPNPSTPSLLTLLLHGAGCTSASFSLFAQQMRALHTVNPQHPPLTVVAFDMRGHGATTSDNEVDLSLTRLVKDAVFVLQGVQSTFQTDQVLLVGHSMGGAIAVRTAAAAAALDLPVAGVVVVDVVEGSALATLPHLPTLLLNRPDTFTTVADAIKWTLDARMVNNPSSALHSVPPMLVPVNNSPGGSSVAATTYTWRTNLHRTSTFWDAWYRGLSADFLSLSTNKLLILASTDRLDKTLMIGQMQGKFQFEIVQSSGHSVHEDQPQKMAMLVWKFVIRTCGGGGGGGSNGSSSQSVSAVFDSTSLFAKKN